MAAHRPGLADTRRVHHGGVHLTLRGASPVELHTFPSDDPEFAEAVALAGDDLAAPEPDDLQEALRERYPSVRVSPSELTGTTVRVWYVYRDGRLYTPGAADAT
jgi:hypothetical protein